MPTRRPTPDMRRRVFERAKGYCEYCYSPRDFSPSLYVCEHIFPFSGGGLTTPDNLAVACEGCNGYKGDDLNVLDGHTGVETRLYHPRQDLWETHFRWDADFLHIIPLTATGRVTVQLLKLNRQNVVNIRRLLLMVDKHPPMPIND